MRLRFCALCLARAALYQRRVPRATRVLPLIFAYILPFHAHFAAVDGLPFFGITPCRTARRVNMRDAVVLLPYRDAYLRHVDAVCGLYRSNIVSLRVTAYDATDAFGATTLLRPYRRCDRAPLSRFCALGYARCYHRYRNGLRARRTVQ